MTGLVRNLSEQLFEIVREQVVMGKLAMDSPIRQSALAAKLGVSKIPLREALARLQQEGLLTSQANRGFFVQHMSMDQLEEIYQLRAAIEPAAAAHGAMRANEAERAAARDALARLESLAEGDVVGFAVRNRDFHAALVWPGGRMLTHQLVERLAILAERYIVSRLQRAGIESSAHREHRELLDAWLARDRASVERLMSQHLAATLSGIRRDLGTRAYAK